MDIASISARKAQENADPSWRPRDELLLQLIHLIEQLREDATASGEDLAADYHAAGGRSRLRFEAADVALPLPRAPRRGSTPERQARHLAGRS